MIQPKTDQLRYAQTGGKGQVQHRPVPDTELGTRVGALSSACISSRVK